MSEQQQARASDAPPKHPDPIVERVAQLSEQQAIDYHFLRRNGRSPDDAYAHVTQRGRS